MGKSKDGKETTGKSAEQRIASSDLLCCPFCGSDDIRDKGYGISCCSCGVWIGDGSDSLKFGGYRKLWNTRA